MSPKYPLWVAKRGTPEKSLKVYAIFMHEASFKGFWDHEPEHAVGNSNKELYSDLV